MTNPAFRPLNTVNALAEHVFFFEFAPQLSDSDMTALEGAKEKLKAEFPESKDITRQSITIDAQAQGMSQTITHTRAGYELIKRAADNSGSPEWLIRITPESVSLHSLKYTRWEPISKAALGYVEKILTSTGTTQSRISAVGIKCTDRFIYEGEDGKYDLSKLMKQNTHYLTSKVWDSSNRWHCHSGWFDKSSGGLQLLNQLNIESGVLNLSGIPKTAVTIDHTMISSSAFGDQISFEISEKGRTDLETNFNSFHEMNKDVMMDLLTQEMCDLIKLKKASVK